MHDIGPTFYYTLTHPYSVVVHSLNLRPLALETAYLTTRPRKLGLVYDLKDYKITQIF